MVFTILGIVLCTMAVLQFGLWTAQSWTRMGYQRRQYERSLELMGSQIELALAQRRQVLADVDRPRWQGYRDFRVDRIVSECQDCVSIYLKPVDGKPLANFLPGQHLAIRLQLEGLRMPVVRCYSLSDAPGMPYYRITVKMVVSNPAEADSKPGLVSHYLTTRLREGDLLEAKAPSGKFHLDHDNDRPLVLLAGGIGVTPMISMIQHLLNENSTRLVVLVYGVRNGKSHAFKRFLADAAEHHANLHVVTAYSSATAEDRRAIDYQIDGHVTTALLQRLLPHLDCEYYLCGPPGFMNSIYYGLVKNGVPDGSLHYEAFGPATIRKSGQYQATNSQVIPTRAKIQFADSQKKVSWDNSHETLLDLAEANQVIVNSGCRAGNCGTCATRIIRGQVSYPPGIHPECPAGECLVCVARPKGDLELDA